MDSDAIKDTFNSEKEKYHMPDFNLKDEQASLAASVLSGKNAVGFLPTGFGKSLVFVLPTIYWKAQKTKTITIVVSPLKALMDDQIETLSLYGFKCCKIEAKSDMKTEVIEGQLNKTKSKLQANIKIILHVSHSFILKCLTNLIIIQRRMAPVGSLICLCGL